MAGLKHLKNRLTSIKSTRKITKAMQLVSAAKLKRIKERAEVLDEYSSALGDIMYNISLDNNLTELPLEDQKFFSQTLKDMPHLLIIMTSERGLCGSFNSNLLKRAKLEIEKLESLGKIVKLLIIGKKGLDSLKNDFEEKILGYYHVSHGNYEQLASKIKNKIIELVETEQIGACYMYYNKFKNALTQIVTEEQILPAHVSSDNKVDMEFEYEGMGLVHKVINLYIGGQINYGLLQNRASEEGARMTAMDNATRNAGELIEKLTLQLNRSRQAMITTELTEIISGAESV